MYTHLSRGVRGLFFCSSFHLLSTGTASCVRATMAIVILPTCVDSSEPSLLDYAIISKSHVLVHQTDRRTDGRTDR